MLTLHQLRQIAKEVGVTLHSQKSKQELLESIASTPDLPDLGPIITAALALEAQLEDASRPEPETRVVFLPRDPQWAYVFWEIADSDRQLALEAGASQLALRVADVTGLQGGSSHPHTLQEVVVDSHATEWYLPVPLSDRDYRVELGYRKKAGGGWISLASSAVARVPSLLPSEQILDQFVPFSLDSPPASLPQPASPSPEPSDFADSGLHERLYQSATANWRRLGRGSEAFHEFGLDSDSFGPLDARNRDGVAFPPAPAPSGWWLTPNSSSTAPLTPRPAYPLAAKRCPSQPKAPSAFRCLSATANSSIRLKPGPQTVNKSATLF